MEGKTVLITGATDGIGRETARQLRKLGASIAVHGRSAERVRRTAEELRHVPGAGEIHEAVADFCKLADVKRLAGEIRQQFTRLDVLVNNAGTYLHERTLTPDGFEMTFAVNHLAPFCLTLGLLPLLKQTPHARIVTVSSGTHQRARLDFDNLQAEKRFDPYEAYALSKLLNVLFSHELAERLRGTSVTSNSLHPGVISTKLLWAGFKMHGAPLEEGAATSVYLASSKEVEGVTGGYFSNCRPSHASPEANNRASRERLWNISLNLTGISG